MATHAYRAANRLRVALHVCEKEAARTRTAERKLIGVEQLQGDLVRPSRRQLWKGKLPGLGQLKGDRVCPSRRQLLEGKLMGGAAERSSSESIEETAARREIDKGRESS